MVSKAVAKQPANVPVLPCGGRGCETVWGVAVRHWAGHSIGAGKRLVATAKMTNLSTGLGY